MSPFLHPFSPAFLISCFPSVLHPSYPAFLESWISPILNTSCTAALHSATHLSCIPRTKAECYETKILRIIKSKRIFQTFRFKAKIGHPESTFWTWISSHGRCELWSILCTVQLCKKFAPHQKNKHVLCGKTGDGIPKVFCYKKQNLIIDFYK